MAQLIKLDIIIDGSFSAMPFSFLSVHQEINTHHSFELRFDDDLISGSDEITITKYQKYLGKSISITFGADLYEISKNQKDKIFKGIITEVMMSAGANDSGSIIIKGYSPTILLDGLENCASYLESNLNQIITKVTSKVPGSDLTVTVKPQTSATLPYVAQYNESNFAFMKRLAADYGEWLMYDGTQLYFGKPSNFPEIELASGIDISDLQFSVKAAPIEFVKTSYSLKKPKDILSYDSNAYKVPGLGTFGDKALKTSGDIFSDKVSSPFRKGLPEKADLELHVKKKKAAIAANLVVLRANSDHPGIHVGCIVSVTKNGGNFGKFLVTNLNHVMDGEGNYSNYFDAIPADVEVLPAPDFSRPYIEPQIGYVVDNKDPKSWGRVKVMMTWNDNDEKSALPWIPVMTNYAGKKGDGGKNRGIHFTPEIEEHVLVGFTENDPSRPFVMGSMPTDDARDSAPNKDNFEKIIRTRSGNTIFFRDKEDSKEQEIRIETDTANYVTILVKNGDGNIEIKSSKEITVESAKTILVKSENITIESTKDIKMNAMGSIELKANKDIKFKATANVNIEGTAAVAVKGTQVKIEGTATTEVKANAMLTLQAAGQAALKGAIVMIN